MTAFDNAMAKVAKAAEKATNRAMQKYSAGKVTDEDDLTGVLIGNLDAEISGHIGGLSWNTSVVRHRRGSAAEEKATGADILIHVEHNTRGHRYSKGVLVQAKRVEPGELMPKAADVALKAQCNTMLNLTPSSFIFVYAKGAMRCGSATKIAGASSRYLYTECSWTSYRFFLELFRCPIGDPRIVSGSVADLLVPNVVRIQGAGTLDEEGSAANLID
jgi:hypothetical protein